MGYLKHQGFRVRYFDDENYFSITSPDDSLSFKARTDRDFVYRIRSILDDTRAAAYAAISRETMLPKPLTNKELTELITTREDPEKNIDMFMVTPTSKPTKVKAKADTLRNWHRRLGHLNAQSILNLAKDPRLGIKIIGPKRLSFCEVYTLAKQHK